jgi:acetyl/propionyl-CoA carboxylase alpha subunit/acetyl-CoA carboxylase carboxyltransferase component
MFSRLLIANRGEIAVRVARTARELGVETVAVYSPDDQAGAHVRLADAAHRLDGRGAAPYLDIDQLLGAAATHQCDAVHPGYGFLSENSEFARRCAAAGVKLVGPAAEVIALFGDKARARDLARSCGVPVPDGTDGPATLAQVRSFYDSLGPGAAIMIKAVAGGGGRGLRPVHDAAAIEEAYARCQSEAERSFGDGALYAERYIRRARHVEVQVVGDGHDVAHLWERDCTLQRRYQKLVEIAPSPGLPAAVRDRLLAAARELAAASHYDNIGTFEFLIDLDRPDPAETFSFIEANPRIQVEHTVTEEVLGLDLVRVQLEIAAGRTLADLSLRQQDIPAPRGHAIQLRVNAETLDAHGQPRPGAGTITAVTPPGGPGVRVDTDAYAGYELVPSFDSLLAKVIAWTPGAGFPSAVARARRAAGEFVIEGVPTSLPFLCALLDHPAVAANEVTTSFIEDNAASLLAGLAPADLAAGRPAEPGADGWHAVRAPLSGVLVSLSAAAGDEVAKGGQLAVLEAMKMEHLVTADVSGVVRSAAVTAGDNVAAGQVLVTIEERDTAGAGERAEQALDLDHVRDDLSDVRALVAATEDAERPAAVDRRRRRGQRTARENIGDLLDAGSFLEYGQLALAFQRSRRTPEELRELSPADGLVMGVGTVNAELFGARPAQVAVASYDATVLAGTQGWTNHRKTDRLFSLAAERSLPLVLFAEGGGGRPGDDPVVATGLESPTFTRLARLSGRVPVVAIVAGRCFAGNAALAGCADVIIATQGSNLGMGGPAMIDGAGLGSYAPEDIGPARAQSRNGVLDILVPDEAAAVAAAKSYLSYFQGRVPEWSAADSRLLRHVIPENRLRAYDVRRVIELVADAGSVLELRPEFGQSFVTALVRVEGRPAGLLASNPLHLAGAIDADGADKAARFLRLCDAHGLPVVSLVDTPGIMVGPEAERTAIVRHAARLFVAGASLRVPVLAVVLRKAYGLGAMAAVGGHLRAPFFTVAWPTGELGGMGLEGAVRLGYKRELEAIADPAERQERFEARVAQLYQQGKATSAAGYFELDAVIDPADTRAWLVRGLDAAPVAEASASLPIDTW